MHRNPIKIFLLFIPSLLLLSACSAPAATPAASEMVETMVTGTLAAAAVAAPSQESPTAIPPMPEPTQALTTAPSPTPQPARYYLFPPYGVGGTRAWQIDGDQATELTLPDLGFTHYDHSSSFGKVLHPSHFPGTGLGPANLSVGDLWSYDVAAQQDQRIIQEENVVEAVFVPNSLDIVYLRATPDTYELRWRSADGSQDIPLAKDVAPTFSVSPDGKSVAFTRETGYKVGTPGVYIVSTTGGDERQIGASDRNGSGSISDLPVWSPDSQYILLPVMSQDIPSRWVLLKASGGLEQPLSFATELSPDLTGVSLAINLWLPNGQQVFLSQVREGLGGTPYAEESGVATLDLSTGKVTQFTPVANGARTPLQWEVPGKVVWALDENGDLTRLDLEHPRPLPRSCKVAQTGLFVNPPKGYCLAFPHGVTLQAYNFDRPLFLGEPLDQSIEPLQARLWIEANDVTATTTLEQALASFMADLPPADPPTSVSPSTLGGEPAFVLENVPGQLFSRVVLSLHNGKLYQLWFNPLDSSVPQVQPDVEALYQTVIDSFAYLP